MSFSELLEAAKSLPSAEQLQLIDALSEPALSAPSDEELVAKHFPPGVTFDVWSPFDAFEAADTLQNLLVDQSAEAALLRRINAEHASRQHFAEFQVQPRTP